MSLIKPDKSADGYIKDFESVLTKDYDFQIPMCTDNCPPMTKALRNSSNSPKIYCLCSKLAKFDDKNHQEEKIFKELDNEVSKMNSYFNSRHLTSKLNLLPVKSTSTTRPWQKSKSATRFAKGRVEFFSLASLAIKCTKFWNKNRNF